LQPYNSAGTGVAYSAPQTRLDFGECEGERKERKEDGRERRNGKGRTPSKNPDIDVLIFISQILVSFWGFVLSPQQLHSIPWTSLGDFRLRPPAALPGLIRAFPT